MNDQEPPSPDSRFDILRRQNVLNREITCAEDGSGGCPPAEVVRVSRRPVTDFVSSLLAAGLILGLAACAGGGEMAVGEPGPRSPAPPMAEPTPIPAGQAPGAGRYDQGVDILDYRLELELWEGADSIRGRTRILLERTDSTSDRLVLDFTGMAVDSVRVGPREYRSLEWVPVETYRDSLSAGRLPVPLPDSGSAGDTVAVVVDYRGVPDDGLILGTTHHGTPSVFADNWPNRARYWFPSVDHPSDKATATFIVRAPATWQVIANGALLAPPTATGDRRTWRWEIGQPIPTYTMVIGATRFVTPSLGTAACGLAPESPRRDGCVDVSAWLFPPDSAAALAPFERAVEMVDFFAGIFGPYPYEKLAHVQAATRFGGMENTTAIFYPGNSLSSGEFPEDVVVHETTHQWFGDAVTEADWHHLWLSEGFADYGEALFYEEFDGVEAYRRTMEAKRRTYLGSGVAGEPIVNPDQQNLFALLTPNNYDKGAWVLHMLRGVLGDDPFFRGLRRYYELHAHGTALTDDFREAMEEVSGRDLRWFFDQWIFEPGYPIISADVTWNEADAEARLVLEQTQPAEWPAFRIPAQVEFALEGGEVVRREIEVIQRTYQISVPLPARPVAMRFDPDGWVLKGDTSAGQ